MALATRCPYCHTTFRVVHDQLKLRSGMVRCGQCQHIFNGIEHLIRANEPAASPAAPPVQAPVQTIATPPAPVHEAAPPAPVHETRLSKSVVPEPAPQPRPMPEPEPAPRPVAEPEPAHVVPAPAPAPVQDSAPPEPATPHLPALAREDAHDPPGHADMPEPANPHAPPHEHPHVASHSPANAHPHAESHQHPPRHSAQPHEAHEALLRIEPTLDDEPWLEGRSHTLEVTRALENLAHGNQPEPDTHPLHQTGAARHDAPAATPSIEADLPEAEEPEEPGFVKAARQQQKWQGFWFWLRAIGVLLLTALLLAQAIYAWRDLIAIRWPITKAPMLEACAWLHCKIDLPTQIQQLSIELGELQTLPRNKNTFSYNTLLRNHSNLPQSWPHIELVLLDNSDKVIARRVFSPKDYQITAQERSKGFAAQSERAVRLYFETAPQLKALGYRAEIFYP
jgi:predicted Zn finger-like uncharacterized protein